MSRFHACVTAAIASAFLASPAWAVVRAKFPLISFYETATLVAAGKVTAVDASAGTATTLVLDTLTGKAGAAEYRVKVGAGGVPKAAVVGSPAAILLGQRGSAVHVGDCWLLGKLLDGDPPTLAVEPPSGDMAREMRYTFPGRTEHMLDVLKAMHGGLTRDGRTGAVRKTDGSDRSDDRGPIVNSLVHKGFKAVEKIADLGVAGATCVWSGDIEKGKPVPNAVDLLIANGKGARLFRPTGAKKPSLAYGPGTNLTMPGYVDATGAYELDKAPACRQVAAGDVNGDGLPDLLLGNTVWVRTGKSFVSSRPLAQLPDDGQWAGATIADATGDGKADIVVLTKAGELIVLKNAGPDPAAWPKTTRTLWTDGAARTWAVFSRIWSPSEKDLCVIVARKGNVTRYACEGADAPGDDMALLCGEAMAEWDGFTTADTSKASGRGSAVNPAAGTKVHPLVDEEVMGATAVDLNGRYCLPDYLLLVRNADGMVGGLPMGYRGFGQFLANGAIVQTLDNRAKAAKADLPPGTQVIMGGGAGAGTRQHVLLLTPHGQLWRVFNAGG